MDKVLVISYFSKVDTLAPSHHIDDRLPYLSEKADVVLLSSSCGSRNEDVFAHTRIPSPAPSGIRYELRHFLKRRCRTKLTRKFWEALVLVPVLPLYLLEKIILKLDSTWSWFLTASVTAWVLAIKHRPKAIYSTGGPVCAHLAAIITSRLTGIPYVAEFQDSVVNKHAAPGWLERLLMKWVEGIVFRTADKVVFLTGKAAQSAEARHGKGKAVHIYAGGEPFPKRPAAHENGPVLRFSHFGSLGGSRNLDCFLDALEELLDESPELKDKIVLELYGHSDRKVLKRIEESSHRGAVHAKGKIKRSDSLGLMTSTDVLLLIQNADVVASESIPSKTYEYLHAGRPILALVYRNPELKAMLEEYGHIVCEADDRQAVKKALRKFVSLWEKKYLEPSLMDSRYTVEAAVSKLFNLWSMAGVVKKGKVKPRPAGNNPA